MRTWIYRHWVYAIITSVGLFLLLSNFNPFKQNKKYPSIEELQNDHIHTLDEIDQVISDIIADTIASVKSEQLIRKLTVKLKSTHSKTRSANHDMINEKVITFDTIHLPYPINDTILTTFYIKDTCYDTIWLRDTLKLISKPKLFGKYDTDTIKL